METLFKKDIDQVTCMCYSEQFHLYFVCTRSLVLMVLNEYLNVVVTLPLDIRLVQKCIFIDETQQLLTAGVAGCFLIQLNINYKYDPRQAILLDPKGHSIEVSFGEHIERPDG